MSMSSDAMVERRQLRRRVTFWRVVGFLAVLILPLGYISWKVRTSIETSYLHSTEEGMIDTAAVVSEFYARLYGQFGADSGKVADRTPSRCPSTMSGTTRSERSFPSSAASFG